ncbi:hypothetical protein SANTM175S_05269 [Streptomyces antimycoticus]
MDAAAGAAAGWNAEFRFFRGPRFPPRTGWGGRLHTRDHALSPASLTVIAVGKGHARDRPAVGTPPCHRPTTRGRTWTRFTAGILQRIENTKTDLIRARETGDDFLVDVEQSELEDLRRLAAEHGVEVSASFA